MKKNFFSQITALLLVLLALFPQPAQAVCAFGSEPPVLQGEIIDIGPIHFDSFSSMINALRDVGTVERYCHVTIKDTEMRIYKGVSRYSDYRDDFCDLKKGEKHFFTEVRKCCDAEAEGDFGCDISLEVLGLGVPGTGREVPVYSASKPPLAVPGTKTECLEAQGHWSDGGSIGRPRGCIIKTEDGGKECASSLDCQGGCYSGKCSKSNIEWGCGIILKRNDHSAKCVN